MKNAALGLCCLYLVTCAPSSATAPVTTYADLAVMGEALKGVHSAIGDADQATKDRLTDANSRIETLIVQIDSMLKNHENRTEQIANDALDKTFRDANDQLFLLSQITQEAGIDIGWRINGAIVNAAHVVEGIPFAHVKPFVAAIAPTVLFPNQTHDYKIRLLGYFNHDWGLPTFTFPDGHTVTASLQPDNTISVLLPAAMISPMQGQLVHVKFRYPESKRLMGHPIFVERDLQLDVLPKNVLQYNIVTAKATPDTTYDYPTVDRSENTNAGSGEEKHRDIVWSMNDLTPNVDWVNSYDRNLSSIQSAILTAQGGNNPTGDNSNTITEGATGGSRVVLNQYAHGKPAKGLAGGQGANVTATVRITLKLAKKVAPVEWQLEGGGRTGELSWGDARVFTPSPGKPLEQTRLELVDHTFDPPQQKILGLRESYRTKYVVVESNPSRVELTVRSNPIPTY